MRILYVSGLTLGLEDLIVRGHAEATGMPAFLRPLRGLLAAGHRVDTIVGAPAGSKLGEERAPWLQDSTFELVPWQFSGPQHALSAARMLRAIGAALRRQRYDFVYGQGWIGALGCLVARRKGLACGQRVYGVHNMSQQVEHLPRLAIALRQPLRYLSFRAAKGFLLITDDGSRGDRVWQRLGRRGAFDFHFWRNGVDFAPATEDQPELGKEKFLFMPARITAWKGQHQALEILRHLHAMGWTDLKLYIAGPVSDPAYWTEFERRRDAYGLGPFVQYLGGLPLSALAPYYRHSFAVLAPYKQASLGNVVIEALTAGSIVVTQDSPVLDGLISDGETGLRVQTPQEAATRLDALLHDPEKAQNLRHRAHTRAQQTFEPWDQRVAREIQLIETCCAHRST